MNDVTIPFYRCQIKGIARLPVSHFCIPHTKTKYIKINKKLTRSIRDSYVYQFLDNATRLTRYWKENDLSNKTTFLKLLWFQYFPLERLNIYVRCSNWRRKTRAQSIRYYTVLTDNATTDKLLIFFRVNVLLRDAGGGGEERGEWKKNAFSTLICLLLLAPGREKRRVEGGKKKKKKKKRISDVFSNFIVVMSVYTRSVKEHKSYSYYTKDASRTSGIQFFFFFFFH